LVLVLKEAGREMACELCNHPKASHVLATAANGGFIDQMLEIEWSNVLIEIIDTTA
jgi:hypothetical protein